MAHQDIRSSQTSRKLAAVTSLINSGKIKQMTKDGNNGQPITGNRKQFKFVDLELSADNTADKNKPAEFACQEASNKSEFPIQVWMKTAFNLNAKNGGGTALLLISGKSTELNFENVWSEMFLIRCGFDGNHFEATSLVKGSQHSVDHHMEMNTDSNGILCPAALCGDGHCFVISNIAPMGNCACAVVFEESAEDSSTCLGLKAACGPAGGCFIVLCSASSEQRKSPSNLYFLHQGDSDGDLTAKAFTSGEADQWQFQTTEDGDVEVRGPRQSHYSVVSNFSGQMLNEHADGMLGKVYHTQAFNGSSPTTLLTNCSDHVGRTLLLMCSCSSGRENDTASGLYQVIIQDATVESCFLGGSSGKLDSPSVWNVTLTEDKTLVVIGPASPCRYGYISNIAEDVTDYTKRCDQSSCLATGMDTPIRGGLELRNDTLVGWVGQPVPVKIWLNEKVIENVEVSQLLKQPDGRMGFRRELKLGENDPGLKLFRAFAVVENINKELVDIELSGSPIQLECQPTGVQFAVNFGGPAFESKNNVVYSDTQTLFKVDPIEGYKCTRVYSYNVPRDTNLYALVSGTDDGFLYGTCNETRHYYENARGMNFDVDLPNGEYCLRIHSVGDGLLDQHIDINGVSHSKEVLAKLSKMRDVIHGSTAKDVTIPFTVDTGKANIHFGTNLTKFLRCFPGAMAGATVNPEDIDDDEEDVDEKSVKIPSARPCALMIYDPAKYSEPVLSEQELGKRAIASQKLSDKLIPMERNFQNKEFKIAGWSSNLLENASGEAGDLSHWNVSGSWETSDGGGDQTETKFISSFMTCSKYQEVDLTRFFSEDYLDTSPEIQASESFHEGTNNGGFYSLTVTLLSYDGEIIEKKTTGEIGTILTPDWIKESFTFKDYAKGVRLVGLESTGRDDKYWAGHFGSWASAAMVRVKSDAKPAENDADSDIVEDNLSAEKIQQLSGLIVKLNDDYSDELKDMEQGTTDISTPGLSNPDNAKKCGNDAHAGGQRSKNRKKKKREIRIFVSSTFVDFKDEREILIKKAFREVNRICLDRGVFFTYVDLRWGITSDQSKDGKTISICLREVEKCRPYFICLLGDRFGWSQTEEKKDELLDKSYSFAIDRFKAFGWLEDFRHNTSVTKLEILHGALRAKKDTETNRTFFYLRDPRVQRDALPTPEAKKPGENQWHYDQQHQLREQIKCSGLTFREFSSAEDGCAKIKADLIRCVNEDFPPGSELSHHDREKEAHEAFADVRKRVYFGREEYFNAIDKHFDNNTEGSGNNKPLVILGQSGSGKSALVANWCGRFEEKNPDDLMFMHFIGSSAESASHLNILRRLYEEIRIFTNQEDLVVPTSDRNLVLELPAWLKLASNSGRRIMLVLDALNQLDSGAGSTGDEQDLKWLPKELPPNVHLLMSTLPGRAGDAVKQKGWSTMEVFPLNRHEKLDIVSSYMSLYAKTLNEEQTALIIEAEQSNNPLYLKALLDEVRMYGSFEQLTNAIRSYLTAEDPGKLFVKILERLEADFDHGNVSRPGLVRDTTVALWCSRRGMSEQELVNFLQVPSIVWSPFYLSLEENLVNRNGIVNFFHDYMRQAVEQKYLLSEEDKQKGYLRLSDFFRKQDIDDRYVEEVPFLLARAGHLKSLRAAVLNVAVFQRLMNTEEGKYQLIRSWHILGGYEQVEEAYLAVLRSSNWKIFGAKAAADLMRAMAGFFMQLGLLKGARYLLDKLLVELETSYFETHRIIVYHHANYSRKIRCNHPDVIDVLIETGTVCSKLGLLDEAYDILHDALSRQPRPRSPAQKLHLVRTMMEIGSVKRLQKNPDEAKKFLIRAQELATEILGSNHHYVSAIIGQIGELSYGQGKLEDAILHFLKDLKLTQRELGLNHPRVAAILNNIALVLDDLNNKVSGELFQIVLAILVSAYGKDHVDVAIVRYNMGAFFLANNYFQRAGFQLREALRIFRGFLGEDHPHTMATIAAVNSL